MDNAIATIDVKVTGLDRLKEAIEELNGHLQEASSILESLDRFEIGVAVASPLDGTQARIRGK